MIQEFKWTNLKIDGQTPLNKASRRLRCTRKLIDEGGEIVRLANGERVSLRRSQFDKYAITLSGQSIRKPAIDHLVKGSVVTLEWPGYFDEHGDLDQADFRRPAVAGTIKRFGVVDNKVVPLESGDPRIVLTTYRPVLVVMIDGIDIDEDESAASVSWSISAEEV